MEVLDALIAREKYYARIGDKAAALKAADDVSPRALVLVVLGWLIDWLTDRRTCHPFTAPTDAHPTHARTPASAPIDPGQAQDLDGEEDRRDDGQGPRGALLPGR